MNVSNGGGGQSGNEGWDWKWKHRRRTHKLVDISRSREEEKRSDTGEGRSPCWVALYYLSSVTRKFPVRTVSWFIRSQMGNSASLGAEHPAVPPTAPPDCCNIPQLRLPQPAHSKVSNPSFVSRLILYPMSAHLHGGCMYNKRVFAGLQACLIADQFHHGWKN